MRNFFRNEVLAEITPRLAAWSSRVLREVVAILQRLAENARLLLIRLHDNLLAILRKIVAIIQRVVQIARRLLLSLLEGLRAIARLWIRFETPLSSLVADIVLGLYALRQIIVLVAILIILVLLAQRCPPVWPVVVLYVLLLAVAVAKAASNGDTEVARRDFGSWRARLIKFVRIVVRLSLIISSALLSVVLFRLAVIEGIPGNHLVAPSTAQEAEAGKAASARRALARTLASLRDHNFWRNATGELARMPAALENGIGAPAAVVDAGVDSRNALLDSTNRDPSSDACLHTQPSRIDAMGIAVFTPTDVREVQKVNEPVAARTNLVEFTSTVHHAQSPLDSSAHDDPARKREWATILSARSDASNTIAAIRSHDCAAHVQSELAAIEKDFSIVAAKPAPNTTFTEQVEACGRISHKGRMLLAQMNATAEKRSILTQLMTNFREEATTLSRFAPDRVREAEYLLAEADSATDLVTYTNGLSLAIAAIGKAFDESDEARSPRLEVQ
jgi:hypothetical protein